MLEGVLIPTAWTAGGEVVDVSLMDFDERVFAIEPAIALDRGLHDLMRRHVRLSALVRDGRVVEVSDVAVIGRATRSSGRRRR